jgi:hypothetical protein
MSTAKWQNIAGSKEFFTQDIFIAFQNFAILISIAISIKIHQQT